MYSDTNGMNINTIDMLEYIEIDDEFANQTRQYNNRQRSMNNYISDKIKIKSSLAIIRLIMLYLFYYLDDQNVTPFLNNLISYLIIHECLVISNCILLYGHNLINFLFYQNRLNVPSFCNYVDIFNNFVFFTWFAYGNFCILSDRNGVEISLINNKMLTYYITVLILLGFFIYSKIIFYIIFFVSFCPCITYILCVDIHQEYQNSRRINRLFEELKEESYDSFVKSAGFELDMCIICTTEFMPKEKVISLPCSLKHTFHSECIKKWLEKKTICPLCRVELSPIDEYSSGQGNNYNPPDAMSNNIFPSSNNN